MSVGFRIFFNVTQFFSAKQVKQKASSNYGVLKKHRNLH